MNFSFTVSLGELSIFFAALFALWEWLRSNSLKRAEFVDGFIEKIRDDKDIVEILRYLDTNDSWYSLGFHDSMDENKQKFEQRMDKTLSYFSYVCYLREKKIITDAEFNFFNYHVRLILGNPGVQDYFYHLYHYVTAKFHAKFQFQPLLDYAVRAQIIGDDIYDPKAHLRNGRYSDHFGSWYA
jgi:hypothetical protein